MVLQQQQTQSSGLTLREAVTTVLVAAVAADGTVGPVEGRRLNEFLLSMRLFHQVPADHVQRLIENALNLVTRTAMDGLLAACAAVILGDLRASLYALAVELVLVDGTIAEREMQFANTLQAAFAIDDVTAMKIVEVLLIKSRA
jgi:uncharacterized tellurite resistance protein B-like protein